MKNLFKALAVTTVCLYLVSCKDGQMPFVKRSELDASEGRNKELQTSLDSLQSNYAAQTKELGEILSELSTISLKTTTLQLKVENGAAAMSQTDSIYSNIDAIKARIDNLEKQAARARKLNRNLALATETINKLRSTVANQEKEILSLKSTIAEKEKTIQGQKETIAERDVTIQNQENELLETLRKQTEMLFKAGGEFEAIADEGSFKITGKKNKMSVNDFRISLYEKAINYYKLAAQQNHPAAASKITVVESKIEILKNL